MKHTADVNWMAKREQEQQIREGYKRDRLRIRRNLRALVRTLLIFEGKAMRAKLDKEEGKLTIRVSRSTNEAFQRVPLREAIQIIREGEPC